MPYTATAPTVDAIRANRARLGDWVTTTPVRLLRDDALDAAVGAGTLVVEPAGAAALAALAGPLRGALKGRVVGLVVCGANIDAQTYAAQLLQPSGSAA